MHPHQPSTSQLSTSFSSNSRRAGDTPSPLSPTGTASTAPWSAPLLGNSTSPSSTNCASSRNHDGRGQRGLGLGSTDMSNTMWSGRGMPYPTLANSTSSSSRDGENRRSFSPPLIRTSSLPTILPIPLSSCSTTSESSPSAISPSYKKHSTLRLSDSPTSPSRRLPAAPPSFLSRILLRTLPERLLPTYIVDPPSLQYPKSPSLTRDPPTKRHGRRGRFPGLSPRRGAILVLVSVLAFVLYCLRGPEKGLEGWGRWIEEEAAQRSWRAAVPVSPASIEEAAERAETAPQRAAPPPPPSLVKVDYAAKLEELRGPTVAAVEPLPPHDSVPRPLPENALIADTLAAQESADEQAALASVVSEAAEEVAVKVAEVQEKLAMAKVVKPGSALDAAVKAEAKKALDPKKKDASRYKRLLPLGSPSRRYLYGANFVLSETEKDEHTEVDDPELTGGKVKVPSKNKLKKLFEQGRKKYGEEEGGWRSFEWAAPPPHISLQRFVEGLKPDELALRTWIKRLHYAPAASGVGLGASTSASSSLTASSTDLTLVADAPAFDRGNLEKYSDLLLQAEAGHAAKCEGATWLEDYQKMHAEMLAGTRAPKFISYICEQGINCGGLGDRMLGMTSAFFFGLLTQRSFLAEWQSPIPLDVVFDSPHVNWSSSSFTSASHPVLGEKSLVDATAELDIIHFDRLSVDATFGSTSWNPKKDKQLTVGFEKRDLAYQSPFIKFFTNRGMIYRSFRYKHLQKGIKRLGLQPSTAFACISQYLFKPKPPALDLIAEYTSALALPTVFSVGIHIRSGDKSMKDLEYDKINTVKRHSQFFRCARELGETYAQPDQRVVFYLVTDSAHLKADAQRVYGDKLVTTDITPQHVHQKSGHADGVFSAVVEDWILAKTDMLVATQDSGFGKLAAFMHAKEKSTVTIFPRHNPDVMGLQSKKSHMKVDCTSPDVFTTFGELSSEWSLG